MNYFKTETETAFIKKLLENGGPNTNEEKEDFSNWIREKAILIKDKKITDELMIELQNVFSPLHNEDTLIGIAFLKPFGYAGDFKVIDMVYQNHISSNPKLSNWDKWAQSTNGLKAVRNRKAYLKNILQEIALKNNHAKVCNIASGPCRDVLEYFNENPKSELEIDCLDHDINAIKYAQNLLKGIDKNRYSLIRANIFKFETSSTYDFVWSAGLFDYFDDFTFIKMLRKVYQLVNKNGILIVGNFSWKSETRYMKEFVNWHLNYRSIHVLEELTKIALGNNVSFEIESEPEGVNLFLKIKK